MTISDVFLELGSPIIELVPAVIFDPFSCHVHCIEHVDFLGFESVHFFYKTLLSGEILDSFVGSLFFSL